MTAVDALAWMQTYGFASDQVHVRPVGSQDHKPASQYGFNFIPF